MSFVANPVRRAADMTAAGGVMSVVGQVATAVTALTTLAVGVAVVLSLPDIRRYLRIRSM